MGVYTQHYKSNVIS